jgi:hypothetical protein
MSAGARTTDPTGSQFAAVRDPSDDVAVRHALLVAWARAGADGLSDPEAAERAGVGHRTFWKRAGELRQPERGGRSWEVSAGEPLLAWKSPEEYRVWAPTGGRRQVSVITPAGLDYCRRHGLPIETYDELRAENERLRAIIQQASQLALDGGRRHEVLTTLREA